MPRARVATLAWATDNVISSDGAAVMPHFDLISRSPTYVASYFYTIYVGKLTLN